MQWLMHTLATLALFCAMASRETAAEPLRWKVVSVHDGDTLTAVDAANVQHKVRFQGIDAPEIGQPFGRVTRNQSARYDSATLGKEWP
jgi:endonuclease YncB( thermonuclease family)